MLAAAVWLPRPQLQRAATGGLSRPAQCPSLAARAQPVLPQWQPPMRAAGLDGCSSELGVLKRSRATTTNARMAPRALLLELAELVKLVSRE